MIMFVVWLAIEAIEEDEERELVECLFRSYSAKVLALSKSILKNREDAEDAVNNTFLKVIKYRHKFVGIDGDETKRLIVICTRSVSFDMLRKKKRIDFCSLDESVEDDEGNALNQELPTDIDVLKSLIEQETLMQVKEALNQLGEPAKDIVRLRYYYDMQCSEIADFLNINASTVRTILQRSLAKLRKMLEEYYYGENQ